MGTCYKQEEHVKYEEKWMKVLMKPTVFKMTVESILKKLQIEIPLHLLISFHNMNKHCQKKQLKQVQNNIHKNFT